MGINYSYNEPSGGRTTINSIYTVFNRNEHDIKHLSLIIKQNHFLSLLTRELFLKVRSISQYTSHDDNLNDLTSVQYICQIDKHRFIHVLKYSK